MKRLIAAIAIAWAVCAGCQRQADHPVPRRTGYPRVAVYDTVYAVPAGLPLAFEANAQALAQVTHKGGATWLNIDYPAYHASIYCTFTPATAATLQSIVDNRKQRIDLNLNGIRPQVEEIDNRGFHSVLLSAPSATSTPLQFLTVGEGWVVSGSAFFKNARAITSTDSVSPMVETMQRDLRHALTALGEPR